MRLTYIYVAVSKIYSKKYLVRDQLYIENNARSDFEDCQP